MQGANERRQKILAVISNRRHDKIENLAFEFSVSRITMLRDIKVLSLEHNPIYAWPGKNGGVFMVEGCYSNSKYLTVAEKDLLIRLLDFLEPKDRTTMNKIITSFSLPDKRT